MGFVQGKPLAALRQHAGTVVKGDYLPTGFGKERSPPANAAGDFQYPPFTKCSNVFLKLPQAAEKRFICFRSVVEPCAQKPVYVFAGALVVVDLHRLLKSLTVELLFPRRIVETGAFPCFWDP